MFSWLHFDWHTLGPKMDESATTEATEQMAEVTEKHEAGNRVLRLSSVFSVVEPFDGRRKETD